MPSSSKYVWDLDNLRAGDVLFESRSSGAGIVTGDVFLGRQTTENALGQNHPRPVRQPIDVLNFHEEQEPWISADIHSVHAQRQGALVLAYAARVGMRSSRGWTRRDTSPGIEGY